MKRELMICVLFALIVLSNMNCGSYETSDKQSPGETRPTDTTREPPPDPEPTPLEKLQRALQFVQTEIQMEKWTYQGYISDANASMIILTSPSATDEEKELAQERFNSSMAGADSSKAKLDSLTKKEDSITTEINTLNSEQ